MPEPLHPADRHLDRERFHALARPGTLVPVVRELLADLETPVSAYLKVAGDAQHAFLLESVEGGEGAASYSMVGARPRAVATFRAGRGRLEHADGRVELLASADPLELVQRETAGFELVRDDPSLPRFAGGALGYLGYECAQLWERLPAPSRDELGAPDCVLLFADELVVFDHLRHRVLVLALARITSDDPDDVDAQLDDALARIEDLVSRLGSALPVGATAVGDTTGVRLHGGVQAPTEANTPPARFLESVERVQEHIRAGDIIQAVLSQRWSRPTSAQPFAVYRALRRVNPSPYMYFLKLGDLSLVGASPELLVQVHEGSVATHPIAGTRPRGATAAEDLELEAELLADPKERAEHLMLVDLGRNDIGRVAQPGSVDVPSLFGIERFSHVMHISSHVTGTLREDLRPADALRSCFPAGTVTGAPKLRAMEIIALLEPDRRGPYAGAVGYIGYDGTLDAAITIRTILMQGGVAHVQAGAGIVADSIPHNEFEETRNKARAMLRAIDVAEAFERGAAAVEARA